MLLIAGLSLWSFLLLIETRNKVPVSFGDMGGVLFGPNMRLLVLFCISISQVSVFPLFRLKLHVPVR
jgi:proton-coupled amino acid transporter